MKAFRFRLQRVLELRETQLKTEESKLRLLLRQREEKQNEQKNRQDALVQAYATNHGLPHLGSAELVALGHFSRRIERECQELTAAIEADGKRIDQQSAVVVQARSRVRLLEKLKEQRRAEWKAESDHELEELAGEFSNARWLRLQRDGRRA
jgi:flagellar biosynthesis chaperone FliJ